MTQNLPSIVTFDQIDKDDIPLVGGKAANLGEMTQAGFPVPPGFVTTAEVYFEILKHNNLTEKIQQVLKITDVNEPDQLQIASRKIKSWIKKADIPQSLVKKIFSAYEDLATKKTGKHPYVAVRSSATAEDLPGASFAGQQETFLNVKGEANLIEAIRGCWASLFEPRSIFYREQKGFDHFKVGISATVQRMIQSDVSGITFTVDPVKNDKTKIVIESIWGLGEKIVQGSYTPDRYLVNKKDFSIFSRNIGPQKKMLVLRLGKNIEVNVPKNKVQKATLTDKQVVQLAQMAEKIHQHYFFAQDIEWAVEDGRLYILQSRPVTTIPSEQGKIKKTVEPEGTTQGMKLLVKGESASPGLVSGYAQVIKSAKEIGKVKHGEILVAPKTTPDFVPAMKRAIAIVTDSGGQTSHAAIVSRELGIPCVVGTEDGTQKFKTGQVYTVNAKTGEIFVGTAKVKAGKKAVKKKTKKKFKLPIKFKIPRFNLIKTHYKTATKLYVNLAEPELAHEVASRNIDGVGLLRAEFMIAQIGDHPRELIKKGRQKDFIDKLADGVGEFCEAFGERPVIYRTTDFKTNEYRQLKGGQYFEPEEDNPLIGYRGAFRYINDEQVFNLELYAIRQVREKYRNLWVMIPFIRNPEELKQVKKLMASYGLIRSPSFNLWMMVELPANVIRLEDYIKIGIDGVSIGTNDLTMLTLGVDRDNSEVIPAYNELDPAVLSLVEQTIKTCKKHKITSSICGQAPTTHPGLIDDLVKWGITSVSVSPDKIELGREIIYQAEKKLISGKK